MSQDAANERQTNATPCPYAREGVAEIVNTNVLNACFSANTPPLLAQTVEMSAPLLGGKYPDLVAGSPLALAFENLKCGPAQRDDLRWRR